MDWLYYLIEANLYLLIFYGFYRLFLYNETFYNSNRYYLILSSITAFILPILQIGYLKPIETVADSSAAGLVYGEGSFVTQSTIPADQMIHPFSFSDYIYPIYLFIAFCFAIKLTIGLVKITKLWFNANKTNAGAITLIELNEQTTAFSFFNLLFIHPHLVDKQTVLKHEMVHIKQKHSIDILFFEVLQIICWFNPLIYFIKRDITLLHEYIADELTTSNDIHKHEYAMFLIENSFGITPTPLTNQIFNQSILKRRINMLNKKRTAAWAKLRLLLVLPLGGAMLCASTMAFTKDYGYVDLLPEKSKTTKTNPQEVIKVEDIKKQTAPKVQNVKRGVKFEKIDLPNSFIPKLIKDPKTGKVRSMEKRYIVVNGKKVADLNTFYGVSNTQKITELNAEQAIKKYGNEAKYGAVVITGDRINWIKSVMLNQAPPKVDQIKFPPPIVKLGVQTSFHPRHQYNKTLDKMVNVDKRYVIVNGEPITDNSTFHGVTETESVTYLSPVEAIKVYGDEKGKRGAVVIKGGQLKYITEVKVPPAVEPLSLHRNKVQKTNTDHIKFPPPVVKNDDVRFPPPVVKKDDVKFPPPTLKLDEKKGSDRQKEEKMKEDVANLIMKLPPITVMDKETNKPKQISNEDVAKLIRKLPSITVDDKTPIYEIKSGPKSPSLKIVVDKKNP
jgi:hypothetical protein